MDKDNIEVITLSNKEINEECKNQTCPEVGEIDDISNGVVVLNNIVKRKIIRLAEKMKESNRKDK